jgi:hypothetical protein
VLLDRVRICPYVLIFDGWDEISVSAARGFFEQIDYLLSQIRERFLNRPNRPLVRVIVTGRPSHEVARSSFMKRATRVLTIRPLNPDALEQQVARLLSFSIGPNVDARPERFSLILEQYRTGFNAPRDDLALFIRSRAAGSPETAEAIGAFEVLGLPLLAHLAIRLADSVGSSSPRREAG